MIHQLKISIYPPLIRLQVARAQQLKNKMRLPNEAVLGIPLNHVSDSNRPSLVVLPDFQRVMLGCLPKVA